jgi:hypothetical protein
MKGADSRTLMLALRAWLDEDERNAGRIAELIYEKALAGHLAYFRLLFELIDGKIRPTAEEEWTFEPHCVLVVADDEREAGTVKAA